MVELRRYHVKSSQYTSSTDEHGVDITVKGPAAHELLGPPVTGSIYLEPALGGKSLSEFTPYELRLVTEGTPQEEILPASLPLPYCRAAGVKLKIGRRLASMRWLPVSLGGLFLLAMIVWLTAPQSSTLSRHIETYLIKPHRFWFWLIVILLVPMIAGAVGSRSLATASIGVGVAMSVVLAVLHRLRDSPWFLLMLRAIEFIVLPLLIQVAASGI
jgi:hypothetical protein